MSLLRELMLLAEAKMRAEQKEKKDEKVSELVIALEHNTYKMLPGTRNSFRIDAQNTSTKTQRHAHVYAKPNGVGKQLYSVNIDGSGHDGSSGTVIPASHAQYLHSLGFEIPANLSLESLDYASVDPKLYEWSVLEEYLQ
ncbi:MAG: hypothetical protein ACRER8_23310 [Pseudomonas sp.]|uniref:hypothetical protein n=1 Tax=Pseudomonas sp. TaxID=306 RepID=UPI003D6FF1A4